MEQSIEKGLVLEVSGKRAFVLTPQGEFREISIRGGSMVEVGMELPIGDVRVHPLLGLVRPFVSRRAFMSLAATLAVILIGLSSYVIGWAPFGARESRIMAYVGIEGIPSIEFAIDRNRKVIKARGLNDDGEKALVEVPVVGKKATEAVETLVTRFASKEAAREGAVIVSVTPVDVYKGFLLPSIIGKEPRVESPRPGSATSTMDVPRGERSSEEALEEELRSSVKEALIESGVGMPVATVRLSAQERKEGLKEGISPGRYALFVKAREAGVDLPMEKAKSWDVRRVALQAGVEFIRTPDTSPSLGVVSGAKKAPASSRKPDFRASVTELDAGRDAEREAPKIQHEFKDYERKDMGTLGPIQAVTVRGLTQEVVERSRLREEGGETKEDGATKTEGKPQIVGERERRPSIGAIGSILGHKDESKPGSSSDGEGETGGKGEAKIKQQQENKPENDAMPGGGWVKKGK